MEITIRDFEDWMKPQVAQLFSHQYGIDPNEFTKLMDEFYDHPYQQKKCIRVVAMDGEKVAGFQSFFYWPYTFAEKELSCFQSGNSLVHPDYRGKGIFQKLLNAIEEKRTERGIDFLLGFPVEDSYKSFIRNGWSNILNLTWFIRIINPFSGIFNPDIHRLRKIFGEKPENGNEKQIPDQFRISNTAEFTSWRKNYSNNDVFGFQYKENNEFVSFELKFNKRKKFINELIIGNVISSGTDPLFIKRGLNALGRKSFSSGVISMISIAVNKESSRNFTETLSGFRETKKKIYFIVKSFNGTASVMDKSKWTLFRSDIDTW